jgi:Na+/H+-dicarboxylate symporter
VVGNSVAAVIVSKWEKQLRIGPAPAETAEAAVTA